MQKFDFAFNFHSSLKLSIFFPLPCFAEINLGGGKKKKRAPYLLVSTWALNFLCVLITDEFFSGEDYNNLFQNRFLKTKPLQ